MHSESLNLQHLEELVRSGIDITLASLNFRTLSGTDAYEYLLISECIRRTNTGMVSTGWLRRYTHVKHGGWWCAGLDPQNNWQLMEWGCFKPNNPRQDQGKSIKYEHPPSTPTRVFCLKVPLFIWRQVSERYNVTMPEIKVAADGEAKGFWQWVTENNIPVIICEGAKKAAALLTCGYAAIAIPGITSGYRTLKDDFGNVTSRQLIPDLTAFTTKKRTFYICFDYETQPRTIKAVNNALAQLGCLLQEKNASVKVIRLPGTEKGVDDLLVAQGAAAFDTLYDNSVDLEVDLALTRFHTELTVSAALTLNRRYLGEIPFPTSGLVGVKSAKGTGKTTSLTEIVNRAKTRNQPILLISHRIQLGRFLCDKIGINWGVSREWGSGTVGDLGLCVDSIWRLNPEDWRGAIVILDEVEQCLWHLLNSDTCKEKRVKILKIFTQLISTVLKTGGLVIVQDADLSDLAVEYLQGLSGIEITPWVVVNEWQPEVGWDVTFHDAPNPTPLIHQLELDLIAGRKCYVTTDSRAGRYSCETIDVYIKERLEQFSHKYPKTLVVSSQTTSTPGHAAVDLVANLNQNIVEYDAVFVTPSLGTGVSIDVEHFDRVYGIFQGVISDSEARQALARVRADVPRVVWCASRGIGLIGSGSKNYRVLSYWYQQNHKENLALMNPIHKIDVDMPLVYDPIHLRTWAKFAARNNASLAMYRQSMRDALRAEGHQVKIVDNAVEQEKIVKLRQAFIASDREDLETRMNLVGEIISLQKEFITRIAKDKSIRQQIARIKRQEEISTAIKVAQATAINRREYEYLLTKRSLTETERNQVNKYILQQRYGVEVTSELKLQDDKGYYFQLLNHYYLTHESEYFHLRDRQEWNQQMFWGEGQVFLPDLKTYTLKVEAFRALGVLQFLEPEREFQETDTDLILLKSTALRYSKHIKRALGVGIIGEREKERVAAIKVLSRVLTQFGLKLKRLKQKPSLDVVKTYTIDPKTLNDGRQTIFEIWHERDALILETAKITEGNVSKFNTEPIRYSTPTVGCQ